MKNDDPNVPDALIRLLVEKFLAGTATPEEEAALKAWYYSFDDEAETQIEASPNETATTIRDRIRRQLTPYVSEKAPASVHWYSRPWVKAAAAVVLLAAGWLVFKTKTPKNELEVVVARGERKKLVLPDSTVAWLNADSRLHYTTLSDGSREVTLTGEGFFDVRQDAGHPFLVKAGGTVTRVLGTSFDIKAYPEEENIRVTLATGRVQFEVPGVEKPKTLEHDQQLDFIASLDGTYVRNLLHTEKYTSWIDGKMDFENASFAEVAGTLGRRFGVTFLFQQENLKHCSFLAGFEANTPLKKILDLLCRTGSYTYTFNSDNTVVTIGGAGCPR